MYALVSTFCLLAAVIMFQEEYAKLESKKANQDKFFKHQSHSSVLGHLY